MSTADLDDPLSAYDEETPKSAFERTLVDERVSAIMTTPFTVVSPTTSVAEVIEALSRLDIACVMVSRDDKLVGLFTVWDVLQTIAGRYNEIAESPISEFMRSRPSFVRDSDRVAAALSVVALLGYRHVPVLDADDRIVGIVSARRIADFLDSRSTT